MPRSKKQSAPEQAPAQDQTAEQLIAEHNKLDDWIKAESKRFSEFLKPHKDRLEAIGNQLLALSNTQGWQNFVSEKGYGTAYRSTLLKISVSPEGLPYEREGQASVGREALLDFALDHWDDIGNDLLLVSAQVGAVRKYMEEHEGKPPPGITTSWFTRINVNRG